jgi:hypothetical protein
MNGLIAYIEKKEKLIFSYAIPRNEVETKYNNKKLSKWESVSNIGMNSADGYGYGYGNGYGGNNSTALYSPQSIERKGLENYPKAKALFDYEAEVHGDLTLRAGDIIYILDREEEDGWWTGMIGNRQGLFPSTYVEIVEEKPLPSIHKNEPNEGDTLVARYDYEEGGAEELAFNIGDKIILQAKDESGWWLGKLEKTGVVGWFAPDLVVPLDEQITPAEWNNKSSFSFQENSNAGTGSKQQKNTKSKSVKDGKKGKGKKAAPPKGTSNKTKSKKNVAAPPKKKNANAEAKSFDMDEPSVVVSYKKLKAKQYGKAKVDKTQLEVYLSNKEFWEIFKMSRAEFAKKPGWKQRNLKKDKGLF